MGSVECREALLRVRSIWNVEVLFQLPGKVPDDCVQMPKFAAGKVVRVSVVCGKDPKKTA